MAAIYVRSTDGSNSDNGTTWALAVLDLHTATTGGLAKAGSGGICYLSDAHAGSYAATITYTMPGTLAAPIKIIAGDDAAQPPTTVTTATETTSGNGFVWVGGTAYWYGITFTSSYASTQQWQFSPYSTSNSLEFQNCTFDAGAGTAGQFSLGYGTLSGNDKGLRMLWRNCSVKLQAATAAKMAGFNIDFEWLGGSVITNSTLPNYLFVLESAFYPKIRVVGVDLSVLSGKTLVNAGNTVGTADVKFINCLLPSSITLTTTPTSNTQRIAMYGCDNGTDDKVYRFEIATYTGNIYSETGIYATNGATDGTTHLAWRMVSTANAEYPLLTLDSDTIVQWNETTGSALTVTCEFLMDAGTTLYTGDVWMEVEYMGTSGNVLALVDVDSMLADPLTANTTECTTGAGIGAWTGETAGAKSYKFVSTITPQQKGFISARIKLAKASTTIYVDPLLTIA